MSIIAISGRKLSGKTTFSNHFVKNGYKRFSFADFLKNMLCELYGWDREKIDFSDYKEEFLGSGSINWDDNAALEVAKYCKVDASRFLPSKNYRNSIVFETRRQALQFVGTDFLRKIDSDFHVKKTIELILNSNRNMICDDVRFKNELDALKSCGADSIFIMRPFNYNYNNHLSEITLNRQSGFDSVVLNDIPIEDFVDISISHYNAIEARCNKLHADYYYGSPYDDSKDFMLSINDLSAYWAGVFSKRLNIEKKDNCFLVVFNYEDDNILESFMDNFNSPKCKINTCDKSLIIYDPYIIEDLKLWDLINGKKDFPKIIQDVVNSFYKGYNCQNK